VLYPNIDFGPTSKKRLKGVPEDGNREKVETRVYY
jgi:hypothetical protein